MGRGAIGGCVRPVRGKRGPRCARWGALSRRDSRRGRQPPRGRIVPRLPRPRAERRGAAQAQWYDFRMRRAAVLLLIFFSISASAQQLYRWTDEKGRVHVTDTPPPPNAKSVQKKAVPGAAAPGAAPSSGNEPYALQMARKSNPVTLYTTPGCEACGEARKLLTARGVPFREVS